MPWYTSDGLLYLAVLAGAYYAYCTVPDTLNHIRNLAACPEPDGPGPRKQLQKDAENAIGIETLRLLSEGHSYDLRASTVKIVATRTIKSRTKQLLLQDLASKDEDKRYSAICGIWMLIYHPSLQMKRIRESFIDYDTFHAIITALTNVLADHQTEQPLDQIVADNPLYPETKLPSSPLRPAIRPFHEQSLLAILHGLLETPRPYQMQPHYPDNMTCALTAGLVTRWLKDYPFPCALPENSKYNLKKDDVFNLCHPRTWAYDDIEMARLIIHISRSALGNKQLRDAGLRKSNYTELEDPEALMSRWRQLPARLDIDSDNDIRMINGEGTAGAATPPPIGTGRRWTNPDGQAARPRSQELSIEEEALRRRRREAVVIAEPDSPISQHNILERTDSGTVWRPNSRRRRSSANPSDDESADGTHDAPSMPLSEETEERFNQLILPLSDIRMQLEDIREEVASSSRLRPILLASMLADVRNRVNEHQVRMSHSIHRWNISREERQAVLARLEFSVRCLRVDADASRVDELVAQRQSE